MSFHSPLQVPSIVERARRLHVQRELLTAHQVNVVRGGPVPAGKVHASEADANRRGRRKRKSCKSVDDGDEGCEVRGAMPRSWVAEAGIHSFLVSRACISSWGRDTHHRQTAYLTWILDRGMTRCNPTS